jgi:hypothetical protein
LATAASSVDGAQVRVLAAHGVQTGAEHITVGADASYEVWS